MNTPLPPPAPLVARVLGCAWFVLAFVIGFAVLLYCIAFVLNLIL